VQALEEYIPDGNVTPFDSGAPIICRVPGGGVVSAIFAGSKTSKETLLEALGHTMHAVDQHGFPGKPTMLNIKGQDPWSILKTSR